MNAKRNRGGRLVMTGKVLFQAPAEDSQNVTETEVTESNKVKDTEFGEVRKGTFSITVKSDDDKVLYENKAESFEYDFCNSLASVLTHAGAKLADDQIEFLGTALTSTDAETNKAIGESVQVVVKIYNAKIKADAKSSAYQSLVNKYKPLEGEKKESAQARLVANFIKLAGVSKEIAIDTLKMGKALPEDYTVADFDATPLRRTKEEAE